MRSVMWAARRWKSTGIGLLLLVMWFACWAATVAPGGEHERWVAGNALAFLAGGAFGAALLGRQTKG